MGTITNKVILSRHGNKLASEAELKIDGLIHTAETLGRGTVLQPSGTKWKKWSTGDAAPAQIRILKDEVVCDGGDKPGVGYFTGVFVQSAIGLSNADVTTLGLQTITAGEVRLK
ncbi:hypothetical protein [Bdellovibrio bacteriovorus]|uniref:hypothetical protein n=1 Tax=Bdellovibrio bacteriovorus TaxID=959 RepID=UPI003AA7B0E2